MKTFSTPSCLDLAIIAAILLMSETLALPANHKSPTTNHNSVGHRVTKRSVDNSALKSSTLLQQNQNSAQKHHLVKRSVYPRSIRELSDLAPFLDRPDIRSLLKRVPSEDVAAELSSAKSKRYIFDNRSMENEDCLQSNVCQHCQSNDCVMRCHILCSM